MITRILVDPSCVRVEFEDGAAVDIPHCIRFAGRPDEESYPHYSEIAIRVRAGHCREAVEFRKIVERLADVPARLARLRRTLMAGASFLNDYWRSDSIESPKAETFLGFIDGLRDAARRIERDRRELNDSPVISGVGPAPWYAAKYHAPGAKRRDMFRWVKVVGRKETVCLT